MNTYNLVYYANLKELIEEVSPNKFKKIDGVLLKNKFIEKFGGGSTINMNKALAKLRKYKKINFEKSGVKIFYWAKK